MVRMWQHPFGESCGAVPEFSVGTTRYAANYWTGEVDVDPRHVEAALQSGFIHMHHPQAVAHRALAA